MSEYSSRENIITYPTKNSENHTFLDTCGYIINTLNHALIAIVTFYTCWLSFTYEKVDFFELHVAFTTLGYQFLMAETILSLSGENSWTANLSKTAKKHIHWVTAVLGTVLAATGTGMIIYSRKKHFNSLHGKLGLAALVLLVPTFMNGPFLFFARLCNKKIKTIYMKFYHILTSLAAFCVGVACLCTGFQKKWFRKQTSPEFITCFIVFSSLTIIFTIKAPLIGMFKSIKGMCSR